MIRSLILILFYLVAIPAVGLIGVPWTLITGDVTWLYNAAMSAAIGGVRLVGIEIEVIGLDRFPHEGTYIYMCNHISNLDPPIVVPSVPRRTSVLVKKEVFRVPILSRAMRLARFVPVDRANREAAIASVHEGTEVMKSGINMMLFPEGTRSPDGKLLPFKKGPFHLAMESGVPIIPMTIVGTEKLMPKRGWKIRKGKATLVFHAPIASSKFSSREELAEAVRVAMASALPTELRS